MLGTPNVVGLPAFCKAGNNGRNGNGHRHHPHEYMRDGICRAAARAFAGAQQYCAPDNAFTLAQCALRHGSSVSYIRAAAALIEHADPVLIDAVVHGRINILVAAKPIMAEMKLVSAFAAAPLKARAAAGVRIGSALLWDDMISPALGT
jgi:hypothetical protein